jgi:RND family efflux transporter MFP subunit
MAIQRSESTDITGYLPAALLAEHEVAPRALLIAQRVAELITGSAAVIYLLEEGVQPSWTVKAVAGEVSIAEGAIPLREGTLGAMVEHAGPVQFDGRSLVREDYGHLHAKRTVRSLACIPVHVGGKLIAALEVVTFDQPLSEEEFSLLEELGTLAAPSLASAITYEKERNTHLESISRLAQLYDLEKVFNSTLEMDDLMPIVSGKFREILNAEAVNLWMVKDEHELILINRSGEDPTVEVGASQSSGEGTVSQVSDSGEPLLIDDPEDDRLKARNLNVGERGVHSLIASPMVARDNQIGVVEAVNRLDGHLFNEDDLFLLNSIAETAAGALNNAGLLQAERKVEILQTLVQVSTEITSTLNLERVLQAVVTLPGAVIPYERAAIALEQRGKLQVHAVSGMAHINPGDPEVERLREVLHWASLSGEELLVKQVGNEIEHEREETRAKFERYFAETQMRAFYALPLADDEGRVGVLSFESSDPDFLTEAHIEMVRVLAGQATVALRNASFYKEVPFITVLEPLLQKKQKFLAVERRRRKLGLGIAAGIVLLLAVVPIPMRVDGDATVAPARTSQIQPEVEGVVKRVLVREGDRVSAGDVLAEMEDWSYTTALAAAQAKYESANSAMNRALNSNDGTEAGIQRVQAAYWSAEVQRAQQRLGKTKLRTPISGAVTTPRVEDLVGKHLDAGDTFAQVVDNSRASVDVAVDERDILLLRQDASAAIKLDGLPLRTFRGQVDILSPKSDLLGSDRVFYARVSVPDPDRVMRPGMQGRGKVGAGWRPIGFVLFRRPAIWIYSKFWSWLGW